MHWPLEQSYMYMHSYYVGMCWENLWLKCKYADLFFVSILNTVSRNKVKYATFLRKRHNTNPRRGPFHFKSPARIFWRTVRGMMPHKTTRGNEAMARLAMFEGIPAPYDKIKRLVVPEALKAIRMRPDRNFTVLGSLSKEFGWNYGPLVERLEAQRKIKEQAFYAEKKAKIALASKAASAVDLTAVNKVLTSNGY
jgi:large subunit ribosomal protein L13Ae